MLAKKADAFSAPKSSFAASSNGNIDYEDFPEGVPFLEATTEEKPDVFATPKKRYRKFHV